MPDAHLGKGATVGSVIPTLGRDNPGRGRGRHRLRDDRRAHPAGPRGPGGQPLAARLRDADRDVDPAVGRAVQRGRRDAEHRRRGSPNWRTRAGADSAEAIAPNWRLQLGTLGSRQPLHRGQPRRGRTASGCSCTPGRAASATSWRSSTSRWPRTWRERWLDPAARPGPGLPGRGHRRVLGLHAGPALGAALRAAQPGGDDGPGRRLPGVRGSASPSGQPRPSTATTTTPSARKTALRQGGLGCPARGRSTRRAGTPGLIPGSMGTRSYVVTGKGSRVALNSSPHGAGRRYSRHGGAEDVQPGPARRGHAGHRVAPDRTRSSTRSPVRTRTSTGHGDAKDLVEIRHKLRQIVNVKGD